MTRNDAPVGISANKQIYQLRLPFITAASVYNDAKAIVVIIEQSGSVGRGEASGVD